MDNLQSLFILQKRNVKEASLVVARAFQDDLIDSHFFPNPEERKKKLPAFYEYRLGSAVRYGTVYATSSNLEGIAAWLPCDLKELPMWKMLWYGGFKLFRKIGNKVTSKMMVVQDYVESMTKKNAGDKYLHLEMLAVEPKFQRMGYAKKLLEPIFEQLDSEELPCFLQTSIEKNVSLYQYFGFKVVEESTIPGTDVPFWDMLRKPFSR
ncbi:MAG: GNAT family N-acetyltransferase [Candidatus Thorarchaeota archaeon]